MSQQWQISLADPTAPEGEQFVAFIAVEADDWPESERHHHDGVTVVCLEALLMGPVPDHAQTPPHLAGRLLRSRAEVEDAGGVWPYEDDV